MSEISDGYRFPPSRVRWDVIDNELESRFWTARDFTRRAKISHQTFINGHTHSIFGHTLKSIARALDVEVVDLIRFVDDLMVATRRLPHDMVLDFDKIERRRVDLGIPRHQIGLQCGHSEQRYRRFRNGEITDLAAIEEILKVLDLDLGDVLIRRDRQTARAIPNEGYSVVQ